MAAAAPSIAGQKAAERIAFDNFQFFNKMVTSSESDFNQLPKEKKALKLHELLGLTRDDMLYDEKTERNIATTLKTIRKLHATVATKARSVFSVEPSLSRARINHCVAILPSYSEQPVKLYPWLEMAPALAVPLLISGRVACVHCYQTNAKSGTLMMNAAVMKDHEQSATHTTAVERFNSKSKEAQGRQSSLLEGGIKRKSAASTTLYARALAMASIVAGGDGSAGVPYTSIPALFSQALMKLFEIMRSGVPGTTTIRDEDMPNGVQLVKDRIKDKLNGRPISLAIDGGGAKLANGNKVVVLNALSSAFEYALNISLTFLMCHEDAEKQVRFCADSSA